MTALAPAVLARALACEGGAGSRTDAADPATGGSDPGAAGGPFEIGVIDGDCGLLDDSLLVAYAGQSPMLTTHTKGVVTVTDGDDAFIDGAPAALTSSPRSAGSPPGTTRRPPP